MKGKQHLTLIGALIGLGILILDGKTALDGARTGIDLCLKTIVPSLFPFFVLSALLTSSLMGQQLLLLRPLGRLYRIPNGAEPLLIPAFLGGYPVGAQAVADTWRSGHLHREDAQRMLTFCSNPGPAFLFGIAASMLPAFWMGWAVWGILLFSALLVAQLFPCKSYRVSLPAVRKNTLTGLLRSSLAVTAIVCGWVILFRIIISFLNRWFLWMLPSSIQVMIIGLLELSNGCCELSNVSPVPVRFILCCGMLSFGGLCVMMQTVSVTEGLDLRFFTEGKLIQTLFCILLSSALFFGIWPIILTAVLFFLLKYWKTKNNSSIHRAVGV